MKDETVDNALLAEREQHLDEGLDTMSSKRNKKTQGKKVLKDNPSLQIRHQGPRPLCKGPSCGACLLYSFS